MGNVCYIQVNKNLKKPMKKTLIIAIAILFGLTLQSQAASTSSNAGAKPTQAAPPAPMAAPEAQGIQIENAVQAQEQNQVKNQGGGNQIQTRDQNAIQEEGNQAGNAVQAQGQNNAGDKTNNGKSGSNPSAQVRSEVSNVVQTLLQLADRNGGIGEQVRVIAQNQNQNQIKLQQSAESLQDRGGFLKFLVGPNYGELKNAQAALEQNKEQIKQLNQIRTQLSNEGDQQQLADQIKVLEQANQQVEITLTNAQGGFSLFGWLSRLIS
jgi:hypothetical protein